MCVNIKLLQRPKNLDNEIDWKEGLSEQEKKELYKTIPELWPRGEVVPEELYFLFEIDCGMLQLEDKNEYSIFFYEHQQGEALILDKVIDITIKDKNNISWTITTSEQLAELNLSSEEKLWNVLISAILPTTFQSQVKDLLMDYKSAFSWNWREFLKTFVNIELNTWLMFNLLDKHNIEWTQIMLWRLEKI